MFMMSKDYGQKTIKKCINDLESAIGKGSIDVKEAKRSIEIYSWILTQSDSEQKARAFLLARHKKKKNGKWKTREEVVDDLGWEVHT